MQIGSLKVPESNYPYSLSGDVTILERAPDKTTVAAGFSGGELRIFNYINKEIIATFRGNDCLLLLTSAVAYVCCYLLGVWDASPLCGVLSTNTHTGMSYNESELVCSIPLLGCAGIYIKFGIAIIWEICY